MLLLFLALVLGPVLYMYIQHSIVAVVFLFYLSVCLSVGLSVSDAVPGISLG